MKSGDRHIEIDTKRGKVLKQNAEEYSKKVNTIIETRDLKEHESALAIACTEEHQNEIQGKIEHLKNSKHVILIGIGGSSLGAESVYAALSIRTNPTLHVFDSVDEEALKNISTITREITCDADLAVVVASKSGATTETITNAAGVLEELEKRFGKGILDRMVFIGSEGTDFLKIGKKKGVACVTFPESIGGRFSVFSAVGIVPLTLLGIDVVRLLKGAQDAMSDENRAEAVDRAVALVLAAEDGIHTVNFFTFNKRLLMLGRWYRQLLAESIGKEKTNAGEPFENQLLPIVSSATDLHSMAQLYLGGYKGLFTHFVFADKGSEYHALKNHWLLKKNKAIKGHTPREIKGSIRKGVLKAYDKQNLPYRLTILEDVSPYELGFIMNTLMFEVMCLGYLFDVNPFDQPNVESYKSFTRELLKK